MPSQITLARLHTVIQEAFGWFDSHLHEFDLDGVCYGIDDGEGWGEPPIDERRARLGDVTSVGSAFRYVYDFGDDWVHRVDVEAIETVEPDVTLPRCIAGRRACPPEDVGGPWGYGEFLGAITDHNDDEHDSMLEWTGRSFDPESFDLDETNDSMTPIRSR